MLRLIGFFVAVLFTMGLLAQVPFIGAIVRIPFLGFWFTAILLSAVFARFAAGAVDGHRRKALERSLGSVDLPHHKGKLGVLLLGQGRVRKALPLLEEAVQGDPESLEWRYRLAQAKATQRGREGEALDALDSVLAMDEEHGFGAPMLLSAELALKACREENALERVQRFERNHGPSPESVLLAGRVLRALGRSEEAMRAFARAPELAKGMPRYAGGGVLGIRWRAFWARLGIGGGRF